MMCVSRVHRLKFASFSDHPPQTTWATRLTEMKYLNIDYLSTHTLIHVHVHTFTIILYALIFHTYSYSLTSRLMAMGMTREVIAHQVKEKAISESETIYGSLYGTLGEVGDMNEHRRRSPGRGPCPIWPCPI